MSHSVILPIVKVVRMFDEAMHADSNMYRWLWSNGFIIYEIIYLIMKY